MLCEKCKANTANFHLSQVVNGEKRQLDVCAACAAQMGYLGSNSIFMDLLFPGVQPTTHAACPGCGMTYENYKRVKRLGCGECYTHFSEYIEPIFKKVHGALSHTGKTPASHVKPVQAPSERDVLRQKLAEAVQKEEYEQAAALRDEIKKKEGEK